MNHFFDNATTPWTDLGGGIRRKIVGYTPELMSVVVQFDKGVVGAVHAHDDHDQIVYILSGAFQVEVGGVQRILKAGDGFIAPKTHDHGVFALEDNSTLLDQFSPCRMDFLESQG